MTLRTSVRLPEQTIGVKVGRQDSLWGRDFGQFSLAGNRVAALQLATRVFLAGNHISDEQRDKEQERSLEKRRRNLRNLSEDIFERSRGRRRRDNFDENHHKAERNRARDKTLIYNG